MQGNTGNRYNRLTDEEKLDIGTAITDYNNKHKH